MKITEKKLDNGLRLILINKPQAKSVTMGIYVKAGSLYERDYPKGISHFLEHMVFEGTENYSEPAELTRLIEGHGGSYNARTDVDRTSYYCQLPKRNLEKGLIFINQLVFKPLLKEEKMAKEKSVIIEEIKYKNDQPEVRAVYNLFKMMGEDSPIARGVPGTKESVSSITREDLVNYQNELYQPNNMVLVLVGDYDRDKVIAKAYKLFKDKAKKLPDFWDKFKPTQNKSRIKIDNRKIDQAQLFVGVYGYSYGEPLKFAWIVLTHILGGSYDSRLYEILRDKKGYSYAPEAVCYSMSMSGIQFMGGGFKQDKAIESVGLIVDVLRDLQKKGVSKRELNQAKKYLIGSIDLDQDSLMTINEHYGEVKLLEKEELDFNQLKDKIESVTKEQVDRVAKEIYRNDRLNLSVVGPFNDENVFKVKLKL